MDGKPFANGAISDEQLGELANHVSEMQSILGREANVGLVVTFLDPKKEFVINVDFDSAIIALLRLKHQVFAPRT